MDIIKVEGLCGILEMNNNTGDCPQPIGTDVLNRDTIPVNRFIVT